MVGTSSGVPDFPATLIQPSAWKGNAAKFRKISAGVEEHV
jgi:hypothetical protein